MLLGGRHPIAKEFREMEDDALRKELEKQLADVEKEIETRRKKNEAMFKHKATRLINKHAKLIGEYQFIMGKFDRTLLRTPLDNLENNVFFDMSDKSITTEAELIVFDNFLKEFQGVIDAIVEEIRLSNEKIYAEIRARRQDILLGQTRTRPAAQKNRENKSDFIKRIKELQKERDTQGLPMIEKIDRLLKVVLSPSSDLAILFEQITKTKKMIEEFNLDAVEFWRLLKQLVTDVEEGKAFNSKDLEKEMKRLDEEDHLMILT